MRQPLQGIKECQHYEQRVTWVRDVGFSSESRAGLEQVGGRGVEDQRLSCVLHPHQGYEEMEQL
jgi:hypothetical protein